MKRLAILGSGGHSKVIADAANLVGWTECILFEDYLENKKGDKRWSFGGTFDHLLSKAHNFEGIVVGIGDCHIRWHKYTLLRQTQAPLVSLVHPSACVSSYAQIGKGSVIFGGSIVNIDALIGEACIINTGSTVDHDCKIGDAVHIAPGVHLSGNVTIGKRSWVGVGSSVRQGITIGSDVMVGAGSVVVNDIPDGETVMGNPAKIRGKS